MSSYHVNSLANYCFQGNVPVAQDCEDMEGQRDYQHMRGIPYADYSGAAYPIGYGSAYHGFSFNNELCNSIGGGGGGGGFYKTNDLSRHLSFNVGHTSGASFRSHVSQTDVYRGARAYGYDVNPEVYGGGGSDCVIGPIDGVYKMATPIDGSDERQRIMGTEREATSGSSPVPVDALQKNFQARDAPTSLSFQVTSQSLGNQLAEQTQHAVVMAPEVMGVKDTGSLSPGSSRSSSPVSSRGESNQEDCPATSSVAGGEWPQHVTPSTGSGGTAQHVYPWMKRIHPTSGRSKYMYIYHSAIAIHVSSIVGSAEH